MNDYRTKFSPPTQSTTPACPQCFLAEARNGGRAGACPWGSILKNPLGGVYVILWKIEFNCCIMKNYKSHIPNYLPRGINNISPYNQSNLTFEVSKN